MTAISDNSGYFSWILHKTQQVISLKKRFHLFIFRERGRKGERKGEKQCVVASHLPPTGDLAHNTGMGPEWELNL